MTVISVFDKSDVSGLIFVTVGSDLSVNGGAEEFIISKSEWKKLNSAHVIEPGAAVSEEIYNDISSAAERTRATRLAASILSRGDKSASALKRKLRESGISKESSEHAVALLIRRGYIDEDAQCERIATSLLRSKRYGRGRIVQYLIAHGYPAEIAKRAASAIDDDDVREALKTTIEKKFPDIGDYSPADTKRTVASLMRLGFTSGEIFSEIKKIKNNG